MDPTELECSTNVLSFDRALPTMEMLPAYYSPSNRSVPTTGPVTPVTNLVDLTAYQTLIQLKDDYGTYPDNERYRARDLADPFGGLGRDPFFDRAGLKLANMDAVYNITRLNDSFYSPNDNQQLYTYLDIAGGPGSWTQYMQYRIPSARGYGITLEASKNDWNPRFLDMTRFTPVRNEGGDLLRAYPAFINRVMTDDRGPRFPGADVALADGGFESEGLGQEEEYLPLIRCELFTGITLLREHSNMVCKIMEAVNGATADTIYLAALCFQRVALFKPITSRPANSERYLIGLDRLADVAASLAALQQQISQPTPLLLPSDFQAWLLAQNNAHVSRQTIAITNILTLLRGGSLPLHHYYLPKARRLWNIPDKLPFSSAHNVERSCDQPAPRKHRTHKEETAGAGTRTWRTPSPSAAPVSATPQTIPRATFRQRFQAARSRGSRPTTRRRI